MVESILRYFWPLEWTLLIIFEVHYKVNLENRLENNPLCVVRGLVSRLVLCSKGAGLRVVYLTRNTFITNTTNTHKLSEMDACAAGMVHGTWMVTVV